MALRCTVSTATLVPVSGAVRCGAVRECKQRCRSSRAAAPHVAPQAGRAALRLAEPPAARYARPHARARLLPRAQHPAPFRCAVSAYRVVKVNREDRVLRSGRAASDWSARSGAGLLHAQLSTDAPVGRANPACAAACTFCVDLVKCRARRLKPTRACTLLGLITAFLLG